MHTIIWDSPFEHFFPYLVHSSLYGQKFFFSYQIHQCAPGTEPHVALRVQSYYTIIVSNKLFRAACLFTRTLSVFVLPAGPGVNMNST